MRLVILAMKMETRIIIIIYFINCDEEIDEDRTSSLTSKTRINTLSAQKVWSVVESFPGS